MHSSKSTVHILHNSITFSHSLNHKVIFYKILYLINIQINQSDLFNTKNKIIKNPKEINGKKFVHHPLKKNCSQEIIKRNFPNQILDKFPSQNNPNKIELNNNKNLLFSPLKDNNNESKRKSIQKVNKKYINKTIYRKKMVKVKILKQKI